MSIHISHHFAEQLKCDLCENVFEKKQDLLIHERVHHGEEPYKCNHCSLSFRSSRIRAEHIRYNHTTDKHKCAVCESIYGRNYDLKRHVDRTHFAPFTCKLCKKSFPEYYNLTAHLETHNNETLYECDHCGAQFTLVLDLESHIKTKHGFDEEHDNNCQVACKYCAKSFKTNIYLTNHMRIQHGIENLFKCEDCERTYKRRYDLERHIQNHHVIKKLQDCAKPFNLNEHIPSKQNANEQLYECEFCGKTYAKKNSLTRHIRTHTDECLHCSKVFGSNKARMLAHIWFHPRDTPHSCEYCTSS